MIKLPRRIAACLLAVMMLTASASAKMSWQPVGPSDAIADASDSVTDRVQVTLDAADPTTAGIISGVIRLPRDTDAMVVRATVAQAAANAVTFAVHDAATGACLGYWQNSIAIDEPLEVAAAMPLTSAARDVRVFVGTHRQPSDAQISGITYTPARRDIKVTGAVYGSLIAPGKSVRQTFRSGGERLEAVKVRLRQYKGYDAQGPDLVARLYRWTGDMAGSVAAGALVETTVDRTLIAGTLQGASRDLDLSVTYLGGESELSIPLSADTEPGATYVLELATDGSPAEPHQTFITFCWLDQYPHGDLYVNNSTRGTQIDLRMETYVAP